MAAAAHSLRELPGNLVSREFGISSSSVIRLTKSSEIFLSAFDLNEAHVAALGFGADGIRTLIQLIQQLAQENLGRITCSKGEGKPNTWDFTVVDGRRISDSRFVQLLEGFETSFWVPTAQTRPGNTDKVFRLVQSF